jgi:hypothetical protein
MMDQQMDRPMLSTREGGNRRYLRRRRTGREKVSLRGLLIGSAATMAGGLWLLAILGFVVPWFSIPPWA